MSARGFSPLERRLLAGLLSVIRDREPDRDEWPWTDVTLRTLYERCYRLHPERSYELQTRNQRQAMRRALGRLFDLDLVSAFALAWVNLADEEVMRWQGGGSGDTPRWRLVGLTPTGVVAAELLEREHTEDRSAAMTDTQPTPSTKENR